MYAINPELCTFCKSCMEECPTGAIQEGAVEDSCPTDPKAIGYKD